MVKTISPETLARMDPRSREKFEGMPDEVEEDVTEAEVIANGRVASSVSQLITAGNPVRFREEDIVGIASKVRFRSLTARQFLAVSEEDDQNILKYSVCDENGDLYLTDVDIEHLRSDEQDGRTYMHLVAVANDHCISGGTLEGLTEAAAKN